MQEIQNEMRIIVFPLPATSNRLFRGSRRMTRRERLARCYAYQEVDRPAVYSRTYFPPDDPTYDDLRQYLQQNTELKTVWSAENVETPWPARTWTEDLSADFKRINVALQTPRGELHRSSLVGLKTGRHESYFLKTPDDALAWLAMPLPEFAGGTSSFHAADKQIGDAGIVDVYLGNNPAGTVAELFGSETFAMMTATDRDLIHALCERQMQIILNRVKYLLDRKVGPYFSMLGEEYLAPPLHGPGDFAEFNVRYDQPIIDIIHNGGGRIHIHCHGRLKAVLPLLAGTGVDVLHPIEPPPMGDVTAGEAKSVLRGRTSIEGNIQINRMYEATAEEIRNETASLIRDAFDDRRGLIVSPTASPYIPGQGEVCLPQYMAMVQTVLAAG